MDPHRHVKPEGEANFVREVDFRAGQLSIRARAAQHCWGPHEVGWECFKSENFSLNQLKMKKKPLLSWLWSVFGANKSNGWSRPFVLPRQCWLMFNTSQTQIDQVHLWKWNHLVALSSITEFHPQLLVSKSQFGSFNPGSVVAGLLVVCPPDYHVMSFPTIILVG